MRFVRYSGGAINLELVTNIEVSGTSVVVHFVSGLCIALHGREAPNFMEVLLRGEPGEGVRRGSGSGR